MRLEYWARKTLIDDIKAFVGRRSIISSNRLCLGFGFSDLDGRGEGGGGRSFVLYTESFIVGGDS